MQPVKLVIKTTEMMEKTIFLLLYSRRNLWQGLINIFDTMFCWKMRLCWNGVLCEIFYICFEPCTQVGSSCKGEDLASLEAWITVYYPYKRSQKIDKRWLFSTEYKFRPYRQNKCIHVNILSISLHFYILQKWEKRNHMNNSESFSLNATLYKVLENI